MWFLVPISSQFMIKFPLTTAHQYIKNIDQGWLEFLSGQGAFITSTSQANNLLSITPKHPTLYLSISITLILALIFTSIISST
jgi:hypothetical protein